jgi:electron transfer flavoprotein alpha subunit
MACILAIAEQDGGKLKKVAGEVASEAVRQAGALGAKVVGVTIGAGAAAAAAALGDFGVSEAVALEGGAAAGYSGEAWAAVLAAVAKEKGATVVLLGAASFARDLLGRLGVLLDSSPAADCVALAAAGGKLTARRPVYAGKALQTVAFSGTVAIASLRPNVFPVVRGKGATCAVTTSAPASAPARQGRLIDRVATGGGKVALTEAECIVAGGRGLKTPETFEKLIAPLASALGAAVGASRAVVDAGWRPHGEQVGQTGKTVAPKLYFACGISGAIQHLAGMRTSKTIVAINKDKDAPIFKVADYGIVGDVEEVLPALTAAVKGMKGG